MNKYILPIIFLFSMSYSAEAQIRLSAERGVYTQSHLSPVLINPGAMGFETHQELLFNYRNAWATFPGSPRTVTFSYNGPLGNRLGIGAQVISDRYAAFETTKGLIGLSYSINSETNRLSFGLSAEYIQHRISGDNLVNVDRNDQEIVFRLDGTQFFDATFGVYGLYQDKIIYGVAFPSLISSKISGESDSVGRDIGFIVNAGYRYKLSEYSMTLEPSVIVKQLMLTPFHVDLNLKVDFLDDTLTGGVSYTIGADEKFGFLLGTMVNNFGLYYSYNVSFHDFQQYNNGSHEFSLKFNLSPQNTLLSEVNDEL